MSPSQEVKRPSSEESAAANYITTFYRDVQELNTYYAQYVNLLSEIEQRQKDGVNLEEDQKGVLTQVTQTVRFFAIRAFIQYSALKRTIQEENTPILGDVEKFYPPVRDTFQIHRADLEGYVLELNLFLLNSIIRSLLETSEDLVNKVYPA